MSEVRLASENATIVNSLLSDDGLLENVDKVPYFLSVRSAANCEINAETRQVLIFC